MGHSLVQSLIWKSSLCSFADKKPAVSPHGPRTTSDSQSINTEVRGRRIQGTCIRSHSLWCNMQASRMSMSKWSFGLCKVHWYTLRKIIQRKDTCMQQQPKTFEVWCMEGPSVLCEHWADEHTLGTRKRKETKTFENKTLDRLKLTSWLNLSRPITRLLSHTSPRV